MGLQSVTTAAKRAGANVRAAQTAATPVAKRGMFALIERRCRASWLLGAYAVHVTYTPCIVASVTRDGIAKAVRIAGQDWPLRRSDWHQLTVDSRGQVADPAVVAAQLVDADGRAIRYENQAVAVAAIKSAARLQ